MTTRQRVVLFLLLVILMGMSLAACALPFFRQSDPYSIDKWRQQTGYNGPVCILPSVEEGSNEEIPATCTNGVKATGASVNAYEGYLIWLSCTKYKSQYACQEMKE